MSTTIAYTVQRPGGGTAILNACRELAASTAFERVTGLYAFASLKGVRLLSSALAEAGSWALADKRWVISIDGGITEPEALRFLLNLRRAEVRIPYAEELLAKGCGRSIGSTRRLCYWNGGIRSIRPQRSWWDQRI